MKLARIAESNLKWTGNLHVLLGSGEPYTLNWGTSDLSRPAFLYVPIPLSFVRSCLTKLQEATGWYDPLRQIGGIGGEEIRYPEYFEVYPKIGRRLTHIGEAHLTISMGPEAGGLGQKLVESGLLMRGQGIPVPIQHTGEFKLMRAAFYRDERDPDGPLLVSEAVSVPAYSKIRSRLGLSQTPKIPGITNYIPHITLGYLASTHLGFDKLYGRQPRQRTRDQH